MTKEEFISSIKNENVVVEEESLKVSISNEISKESLIETLGKIYDYEIENEDVSVVLDLKKLKTELLAEAVKYSLTREDLKNPIMILNIINLIKIYNTLDETFFENENIYVSSIEELLDLKLSIRDELKEFVKKVSIYFLSLFKSYNKVSYSQLDTHIALPNIFSTIFLSVDIMTLSGIFSVSDHFDTKECVYIDESFKYISNLLMKNSISLAMMNTFLENNNDASDK